MSFPRYERYKDSGVEWLGEVPEHWRVKRLKFSARLVTERATDRANPVALENIESWTGRLLPSETQYEGEGTAFRPGDVLFGKLRPYLAKAHLAQIGGEAVGDFHVMRPASGVSGEFFLHQLLNRDVIEIIDGSTYGAKMPRVSWDFLSNIPVVTPPLDEQAVIAEFVRSETTKIDALIEEQRRLIELLKEKRQAVISHAVTKGLNPDSPMKDTCVDWLGEVPQHWNIVPLRFLVKFISGGTPNKKEPLYWEGSVPWVSAKDMKVRRIDDSEDHISENAVTESGLKLISAGHLLMVVRGMILAHSLPVALTCETLTINQDLKAIKCGDKLEVAFVQFVFEALTSHIIANAGESAHGTKKLESEMLGKLEIPVPPLQEQQRITAEMERTVELLDTTGHSAMQTVELLQERRSALISAAVTGKIDVRASFAKPVMSATQYSSGFAHQLLAAEILDRCNSQRMGRIKLQKLIHLCEYHGQVSEVQGDYSRKAAGPFDARAMAGISKNLKKQKWFEEVREGERYVYRPLEKRGEHKKYLAHWQAEMPRIDEVLSLLGNFKTRECEIVSTLYAAWNDLLIDGASTHDTAILHEASSAERWHKSKEQIAPERWSKALQWMKDKGLVPVGYGKHTRHNPDAIDATAEVANEPA
jgi:type I restriction enzyme S subunit